ncbi:MAG: globin domain-containing protein [Burkholderiales bacterium]|nr:globin domain-containing protein [Burkholderiales bacterium]
MSLTPRQIALVQSTFRTVQPVAATAGELFYGRLAEIDPAAAALFKGDMKAQGQKFMQVLAVAVGGLSNIPTLVPVVQQLGVRHAGYGVRAEHFDSVKRALLWSLAMILQDAYTPEVRAAWATAYAMLAGVMKEAAWGAP